MLVDRVGGPWRHVSKMDWEPSEPAAGRGCPREGSFII